MSYNLLKTISDETHPDMLALISDKLSSSEQKTKTAFKTILPVIINGICHKSTTTTSANALFKSIKNRQELNDTESFDLDLSKSLFSEKSTIQKQIADQSGLSIDQVNQLSGLATGMVLETLGKHIGASKLTSNELKDLLYAQKPIIETHLYDSFKEHSEYADASLRENESAFVRTVENNDSASGWWKWMFGSIISIALMGWLFRDGCNEAKAGLKEGINADININEPDPNNIQDGEILDTIDSSMIEIDTLIQ